MSNETSFAGILEEIKNVPIDDDLKVEAVYCFIKSSDDKNISSWALRSGGNKVSSEELLGMLEGACRSVRNDISEEWA